MIAIKWDIIISSSPLQVAQELGIIPEEEDYINPFRKIDPQPVREMSLLELGWFSISFL